MHRKHVGTKSPSVLLLLYYKELCFPGSQCGGWQGRHSSQVDLNLNFSSAN